MSVNHRVTQVLTALTAALALLLALPAQAAPLRIEITEGVVEPLPFAVPDFIPETAAAGEWGGKLAQVVADDLNGTGLFIPSASRLRCAVFTPRHRST